MSWILKSKRLQSASHGANNNTGSSGLHSNSIYSQSTNNLSSSSLNSSSACEFGNNNNLSSSVSFNNTASAQSLSSHPHHLDAGDDMVRQLNTQKTSFMRWVNVQLANAAASANNNINNNKSNNSNNTNLGTSSSTKSISPSISATTTSTISNIYTPMTSIELDLRDGKRLVALLEEVSKEPLKPERGNMRIHQIANVSKALKFLEERTDEPLGSIGTEDIVDGKLKLTLGLLWIIIYRFQIQQIANTMTDLYPFLATEDILEGDDGTKGKKKGTSQQVDAKQALLRWVRYQLEDYSDVIPPIQDFHRSWRTGLAFAALIHRHDPEFLPQFYSSILPLPFETSDEWRQTLTTAFEVGLEKMKVPRLLEPEDLVDVETPDERSVMTYVTEYYIVMSKHQMEQDPAVAAELHRLRLQAKDGRLALAGEDEQARRFRLQAEESRRKREEEEELERIRLKRMEIEGWSVRAAERAREEEEALRKRREEEEERRLQRKLRREQHEREKSQLLQQQQGSEADLGSGANAGSGVGMDHPSSDHSRHDADILSASSVLSDSERDHSDTETGKADPEEQEKRQRELGEKLAEYHQGIGELTAWVREQDTAFPPSPDMTSLLDRVRDLEPLMETIKVVEEEQAIKEHIMSHLHDVREELLEYENPDLAPEQISEMDKKWWELETIWTSLTNKVVNGKDTAEEIKWIIDCSQEIGRVNGEISKFEAQLEAFAEKRSHETPQERCEKHVLEQQDVSLSSISFLLKTYVDFLTALMDPKVHHYTAPEHLTALNNELTTVRLPRLGIVIEKAQQNLANDRLLRKFFDSFVLSEAWIGESVEWLANIEVPIFVTHDQWNGATTVKEYITRDVSQDLDLEYYQAEIDELEGELKDEQSEVTMFRSSGFAKLDEQAKAVMKSVVETQDVTAEETTKAVQKLMKGVMSNLEKVEKLLPKEAEHCAYAARVLDYLWEARTTLMELEQASTAINKWEMRQPDSEIEVFVIQVEEQFNTLDLSITNERSQPTVREAVQNRHAGLTSVVRNLRTYFEQKQEAIKGDRKMKEFLELTLTCQATLQNFKTKLQGPAPMTGFGLNDTKPFDDFATMVLSIGKAIENFEKSEHVSLVEMGALVTTMSATSSLKQDSTVIQNKLQSVNRLLKETKDLRGDRERDSATMTGCRKLAASLVALDSDLNKLQADFTALEDLEPSQRDDLIELGHRSNQLRSQYVLLEQDSVYCHLVQDPSCSKLLEDIASLQISIQQTQERLQSRLELKQQWDLAWEAFYNCTDSLQGYLNDQEREVIVRDIFALDSLSPDEAIWRKTEDYIHSAEVANEETLSRLKEFETTRLPELIDLQGVLKKAVESAGGLEKLDVNRARRSRKAEVIPKNLTEHLNDIYAMNADDKSLLDTLRKRQLWAQHFTESTAEVDALKDSCLNAICEYTAILKPCERSGDTAGLDHTAAGRLQEQIQCLVSLASKEKEARFHEAVNAFTLLKESVAISMPKRVMPKYLEDELIAFKAQYDRLTLHLEHAGQFAEHALQVASYLEKHDELDFRLSAIANELRAEREATTEAIVRAMKACADFEKLTEDLKCIFSTSPRPSDKTPSTVSLALKAYKIDLEVSLRNRLTNTESLKDSLEPLLVDYKSLLRYQDRLRAYIKGLEGHKQWLDPANEKIQRVNERMQMVFKSWPNEGMNANDGFHILSSSVDSSNNHNDKGGFADLEAQLKELNALKTELEQVLALVRDKEQDFQVSKDTINQTLLSATAHSRQLQVELKNAIELIESRIQSLRSDIRHKSDELKCLQKQTAWEQELKDAQDWCRTFDIAVANFVEDQAQWKDDRANTGVDGSSIMDGSTESAVIEELLRRLDAKVLGFEGQLKEFEDQIKPSVEKTWTDFCGSLVYLDRGTVPGVFENQQASLGKKYQELWSKIMYSAEVVKQRRVLERLNARMNDLSQLKADLAAMAVTNINEITIDGDKGMQKLEAKIRALGAEFEAGVATLCYPVDASSDESRMRFEDINSQVRRHIQVCRTRLENFNQTLNQVLHDREVMRKQQKLEAIQQSQNEAIHVKTQYLEDASSLVEWVNEATILVARVFSGDERDVDSSEEGKPTTSTTGSLVEEKNVDHLLFTAEELCSRFSQEELRERNIRLEKLYQGVHEKTEHKKDMQVQFLESHTADKQESELKVHYDRVLSLSEPLVADNATFSSESSLYGLQENVKQNRSTIEQLDRDISSKFYEFDAKAEAMLVSLEQQSKTLEAALEERMRLDEEERLRALRAIAIGKFDSLKVEFLTWSDNQIKGLTQLWDSYGYIAKNEGTLDNAVKTLETETERIGKELSNQESVYHELKDTLDTLFSSEEYVADHKRHAEAIDSAWSSLKADSNGYTTILNHMYHWLALHNALYRFKKELSHLEQRVEALPSMDWNAFLTEEEAVRQRIMDLEKQAHEIMARADEANAIKFGVDIQAKLHKVLNANKAYFEEQLSMISGHMETVIERIKLEKEIAHEKESERLRVLRAIAVEEFEASKHKFLTWSDNQIKGLTQLWDSYGYIAKNEGTLDNAVKTLETETERIGKELSNQESVYHELKDTLDTLFSSEEYVADHKRHAEAIDSAWSSLKADSNGYTTILNHMNHWLALYNNLVRFEKEGLGRLDRRVEALRWMHWDAFQPEEEALQQCIKDVEDQARDLLIRADEVNAMGLGSNIQADHQAILNANRVYFEEYFSKIPNRIKSAKAQMEIIHETAKEIALHAKFHADLVRVETAIAQQIDAVKARLGSLERSSCFALNSRALEAVVVAANEVCMDGKYQFSVLQEVEYPALEQMAFDLDMLTVPEPADADGNISSIRTGVQGSMERIRDSLKKLEVYIEEDCFETLLAAKFYTHCKATEDIRQWITACRESMAQLDPFLSSRNEDLGDKAKRQQTKDWKTHHLESLEKKMNAFGGTVQHYDDLSSDFMLLHHPDTSALDLTDQVAGTTQEEGTPPISMRVILRQTVQERTKRTREDWELLKQEFLAKTAALDEMNSEDGNASEVSDLNGTDLGEHGRRGSSADNGTIPVVKAKALSRFGKEILEDITRVSREVQEMFDYVPSSHSALSLAMGSDGTLIKSKDGQVRLEMIEAYIRDVLRAKVERFDAMLLAANEQNEQEQACLENGNTSDQGISTRSQMRHHERMVGVAMQRGLIAESMSRLVESCNHQRKEVEETDRVRDAMGLIHEASMLCDEMAKALSTADGLLTLSTTCGMPTSVSLYSLPSTSSSSVSVASIHNAKSPIASPRMSPATTVSRATAISRERRASRAAKRRSFSLSSLSEEDAQQWEANYCGLMKELDRFTQDIEQRLDAVSNMADHLNDWRLDENYGITTEHWQRLKKSALAKKEELDRIRVGRSGSSTASNELNQGSGVHPLDGQLSLSSRPSVMQPTISSSNRAKTNLGTPLEPSSSGQQSSEKKRFSTGNIVSRGPPVPPSTASGGSRSSTSRSTTSGRMRSGTAPGRATASQTDVSTPKKYTNIGVSPSLSSLHGMSATFSQETKRRPSVVHKNDEAMALVPSLAQNNNSNGGNLDVPNSSTTSKQRMVYKPDLDNALDVEVARVVNASGFLMKVKRVKDSQSPYLSASGNSTGANTPGGGMARSRSDSASSLVLSGLSDNGGYEGGTDGIDISSPRAMKVIRDQGQNRLNVSKLENNGIDEYNGQVGRYVFGEIEPKVCYCRILRSRKVMVRIGGGWCELSKFMEDHASLEQRKAKAKLLSASNSSVSMYHFGGSAPVLSGTESGPANHTSVGGLDGSSDSLSAHSQMSGGDIGGGGSGVESHEGSSHVQETSKRNKKEVVYAIRPSDDLALKTIKFVKNGAGEGLVAI